MLYLIYTAKYKLSAPEDEKGCPFHLPVLHPYLPKCCTLIYRFAALLITESVVLLITDYKILYQIVFTPKNHEKTLTDASLERLYLFIWGVLKNKKCHLYRIGGMEDHIHIVTHIHPLVSLSSLVKDIKLSSDIFIKQNKLFTSFNGWQEGYAGFTYSIEAKDNLVEYVKKQKEHHHKRTFKEELVELLNEHGIEYDEKYLL